MPLHPLRPPPLLQGVHSPSHADYTRVGALGAGPGGSTTVEVDVPKAQVRARVRL